MTTYWFFTFIIYLFFWIFLFPGIFLIFFSLFSIIRQSIFKRMPESASLLFAGFLCIFHTLFVGLISYIFHSGLIALGK